ncbi:hypothetical protein D8Y22_10395 [Salinadaptatus halalkaliphilus]|uniref:Uncharacterized protein n=1 Tax=Salinadaptatus halalkaliphilus TaxID=2419781 RepID=A0A4S3TLQ0_9EURY|nr:hypothetical protein [Salinadaptatus halalkaliphilus]THE65006.1 hypothetical protein D8Y22_10395 [Salinadaptatus halalkaliphilus]
MTDHTRRRVLTVAGVAWAGLAAGCLDETNEPGSGSNDDDETDTGGDDPNGDDEDGSDDSDETTQTIDEAPRVDEPPYDIERPDEPEDPEEDDWNEHYLGDGMADEPSLEFEVVPQVGLVESALGGLYEDEEATGEYRIALLESQRELTDVLDLELADDEVRETLESLEFTDRVVAVVESGWGSSSVYHQWVRAEDEGDHVHLHGYYTAPLVQTTDMASRHSVLVLERPDELEFVRASLTVDEERRVHFNSTEGVVSVGESE